MSLLTHRDAGAKLCFRFVDARGRSEPRLLLSSY